MRNYLPFAQVRDNRVRNGLKEIGVVCESFNADLLYEPWEIYHTDGRVFTTFESFWTKARLAPLACQTSASHRSAAVH